MPINCSIRMCDMDQEEFARLDYRVMACAFESQNELGRLCDEVVYQNDLAARLEAAGLGPIRREVPVMLSHQEFIKTYSLDLVVGDAAIYELKTDYRLVAEHEAQLLNYLFLQDAQHGKLVNFRPPQVESKFVNNQLAPEARRRLEFDTQRWRETDSTSTLVRTTLVAILEDWGGFLELPVYTQALTHFLGGEEKVTKMVPLARGNVALGNQQVLLADPDTAFRMTALPHGLDNYEPHLRSLLKHSALRAIYWINLARHQIHFITLSR